MYKKGQILEKFLAHATHPFIQASKVSIKQLLSVKHCSNTDDTVVNNTGNTMVNKADSFSSRVYILELFCSKIGVFLLQDFVCYVLTMFSILHFSYTGCFYWRFPLLSYLLSIYNSHLRVWNVEPHGEAGFLSHLKYCSSFGDYYYKQDGNEGWVFSL